MILAGDLGGTHARLALFDLSDGRFRLVSSSVFPSRDYPGLEQIVARFVQQTKAHTDVACFGVAGPVNNGRVQTSNLPWVVEAKSLAAELHIREALLINDLEASAWGLATLEPGDMVSLNDVPPVHNGTQAIVAAGTGLGEAALYWDGTHHRISPSEGGHTDFAARNELEIELLRYLMGRYGRVSYERVLSGPGLVNVFDFLRDTGRGKPPQWLVDEMLKSDPAAAVSRAAIEGKCEMCDQALDIFISVYGAEAGNVALETLATGGVFVAGGIAPKLLHKFKQPTFIKAFTDKGRLTPVLKRIPVNVVTNENLALLGAARCAVTKSPD